MEDKKEVIIPNWTMFGTQRVNIEIFDVTEDENDPLFNVGLGIILDDGKNDPQEDIKYITIFTNIFEETVKDALEASIEYIHELFRGSIGEEISLYDKDSNVTNVDINFILQDLSFKVDTQKNIVFH